MGDQRALSLSSLHTRVVRAGGEAPPTAVAAAMGLIRSALLAGDGAAPQLPDAGGALMRRFSQAQVGGWLLPGDCHCFVSHSVPTCRLCRGLLWVPAWQPQCSRPGQLPLGRLAMSGLRFRSKLVC